MAPAAMIAASSKLNCRLVTIVIAFYERRGATVGKGDGKTSLTGLT
jgi:hypothetical protein